MTDLHKELFAFASTADRLNQELRLHSLPGTEDGDRARTAANELREYLSTIARKAEYVASCIEVAERQTA